MAVDVFARHTCHGRMSLPAMVEEPTSAARFLPAELPFRSPSRGPPHWKLLEIGFQDRLG
jgi:hypothetical protein